MDIESLIQLEAIRVLKARYCRYMDLAVSSNKKEDWDRLFNLFTEDAIFGGGDAGPIDPDSDEYKYKMGHLFGRAQIEERFTSGVHMITDTVHHCHMPEIELTSATTASAVWMYEDLIFFRTGDTEYVRGFGYYHDTYIREDGVWKIKTTMPVRSRYDAFPRRSDASDHS